MNLNDMLCSERHIFHVHLANYGTRIQHKHNMNYRYNILQKSCL